MNFIYFLYYIINADYEFIYKQVKKLSLKSKFIIYFDIIYSSLRYGGSFEDYFIYDFSNKNHNERNSYALTGLAHRFFKQMNDKNNLKPFRDKKEFDEKYKEFIKRDTIIIDKVSEDVFLEWCYNKNEVIVKPIDGVQGKGIYKTSTKEETEIKKLFSNVLNKGFIVEEVIKQHSVFNELNDSCVNSLRIITVNINNEPKIIASILRIGVGAVIDNFSVGGIAAPIDPEKGIVSNHGITKIKGEIVKQHPISKVNIKNLKIPYWNQIQEIVLKASKVTPLVKTVGWDIAITENGPEIIEGNDNWNKNIFQLPFKKGKKEELKEIMKKDRMF